MDKGNEEETSTIEVHFDEPDDNRAEIGVNDVREDVTRNSTSRNRRRNVQQWK